MQLSGTRTLLNRVVARQRTARLAARVHVNLLFLAGAYFLVLLAARLTGLVPVEFGPASVVLPPAAALGLALVLLRRSGPPEAARLVDRHLRTRDLFLTAALADTAVGAFKPLVLERAETASSSVRPGDVVPYRWWPGTRNSLGIMAVLVVGCLFLPGLDPFGLGEGDRVKDGRRKRLDESRKATALQIENLEKEKKKNPNPAVNTTLARLKKAFRKLKPGKKNENRARLQGLRNQLHRQWKKVREGQQKKFNTRTAAQHLGGLDAGKRAAWRKALEKGDTAALEKEMREVKKLAEKLSSMADSPEKQRLRQALERRLQTLKDLAALDLGHDSLRAALERALEQLDLSDFGDLERNALRDLCDTLDLSASELGQMLDSLRALRELEDAMEACQLARGCCGSSKLPGGGGKGMLESLEDYKSFYRSLCQGAGTERGAGPGMQGPGTGAGGQAPEDDTLETGFRPELSRSAMRAGKFLLKLNTRGLSPTGKVEVNYKKLIRDVRQGMSEAVLQERIPREYHGAIKKYFDAIEKRGEKPSGK